MFDWATTNNYQQRLLAITDEEKQIVNIIIMDERTASAVTFAVDNEKDLSWIIKELSKRTKIWKSDNEKQNNS